MNRNLTQTAISKTGNVLAEYTEMSGYINGFKGSKDDINNISPFSRCFYNSSILNHTLPSLWQTAINSGLIF